MQRDDELLERIGQAGKAEEADIDQHAPDQREDHHRQLRRLVQGLPQLLAAHAVDEGRDQHDEGAERAGFRRRGIAVVERAEDDRHDRDDRQGAGHRGETLAPGEAAHRRGIALPHGHADDDGDVDDRREDARQEAGEQQLGDRLFHEDGVDHQDRGGRDQRGQRATGRNDRRRQALGIADLQHLGDGDAGEDRGRCDRGAGDGGKAGRGEDRADRHAAGQPAEPALGRLEQLAGEAGIEGEKADQDEGRQHRERIGHRLGMRDGAGHLESGDDTALEAHAHREDGDEAERADKGGGKGNAHAQHDEDQQQAGHDQSDFERGHRGVSCPLPEASSSPSASSIS